MLVHIGQPETASKIHNAWFKTLEDGIYTGDIAKGGPFVGTSEFADAVIKRLGEKPETIKPMTYVKNEDKKENKYKVSPKAKDRADTSITRELEGVDVFLFNNTHLPDEIGTTLEEAAGSDFELAIITNRGVKAYPGGFTETFTTDHWRCRFLPTAANGKTDKESIMALLNRITEAGLDWIKVENLYSFDGNIGYSEAKK